jgi:hypothetical protein
MEVGQGPIGAVAPKKKKKRIILNSQIGSVRFMQSFACKLRVYDIHSYQLPIKC